MIINNLYNKSLCIVRIKKIKIYLKQIFIRSTLDVSLFCNIIQYTLCTLHYIL